MASIYQVRSSPRSRLRAAVLVAAACAAAAAGRAASADPFLSVDVNSDQPTSGTYSPTLPGFTALNVHNRATTDPALMSATGTFPVSDPSAPSNSITVTFTSSSSSLNLGSRSRTAANQQPVNGGAFTYADLYRDLVFNNGGNSTASADSSPLNIALSGLSAGTQYDVRLYVWDPAQGGSSTVRITNTTGGTQPAPTSGTIFYQQGNGAAATPATNDTYSLVLRGTATGTGPTDGALTFTDVAVAGSSQTLPVFNGLTISSVPEPAGAGLLAVATAGLLARRRRRRHGK